MIKLKDVLDILVTVLLSSLKNNLALRENDLGAHFMEESDLGATLGNDLQ